MPPPTTPPSQLVECLPMGEHGYPLEFQPGARRLDSGGRPSHILMPMLRSALSLLLDEIGVETLVGQLRRRTSAIASAARQLGFHVPSRHSAAFVGIYPAGWMEEIGLSAAEIVNQLSRWKPKPVIVAERFGALRISPHLYNTDDEIDTLLRALQAILGARRQGQAHADRLPRSLL